LVNVHFPLVLVVHDALHDVGLIDRRD